eukprot:4157818-Amphidinium_carterae.3
MPIIPQPSPATKPPHSRRCNRPVTHLPLGAGTTLLQSRTLQLIANVGLGVPAQRFKLSGLGWPAQRPWSELGCPALCLPQRIGNLCGGTHGHPWQALECSLSYGAPSFKRSHRSSVTGLKDAPSPNLNGSPTAHTENSVDGTTTRCPSQLNKLTASFASSCRVQTAKGPGLPALT